MSEVPKRPFEGRIKPYPHVEKNEHGMAPDPVGYLNSVQQRARERMVATQTVKILRDRVIACYQKEGVNHYENCRKVGKDYYDIIIKKDNGQLQPEWSNPEMKDGWA
mmetsp:Transcript_18889/g.24296  ORF Transcript_18889/g.24296 Transcript_18889/m.24296 type:complete len:107 (-) Transcript_18889:191-511(-)|eukprot:CAMPEP_0198152856 /NCGR_PEP_ID=MMETSP1443-20131203/61522_1 /TAXON_ID=186043 /ORGANISM="Entomoneis sp., Strain CCMP2396" /LENGTH=106 /DNA_ID=CAMNT_0043818989 /DNA_START=76 /DNA_END=396 /DNA_ORIENTATION=-